MKAEEITDRLIRLEKNVRRSKHDDNQTKYQTIALFRDIRGLIEYQIPMPPINVSEDGHQFECPHCHTQFESKDHADDFIGCHICLQRWKEREKDAET